MCARKIKKSYISCTGYFASRKNNRQMAFESTLERDVFMMLEFDNDVTSYEEQPFTMKYALNGRATKYTPDAMVAYNDGTKKVFEVKYQDDIDTDEDLQQKLSTVKDAIWQQYAMSFETYSDRNIDDVYLENCKFLYKFAFMKADEDVRARITALVRTYSNGISVKEILDKLAPGKDDQLRILPFIWLIVLGNTGLVNMHKKLTINTKLIMGEHDG